MLCTKKKTIVTKSSIGLHVHVHVHCKHEILYYVIISFLLLLPIIYDGYGARDKSGLKLKSVAAHVYVMQVCVRETDIIQTPL